MASDLYFKPAYFNRHGQKRHQVFVSDDLLRELVAEATSLDLTGCPAITDFFVLAAQNLILESQTQSIPVRPRKGHKAMAASPSKEATANLLPCEEELQ